MSCQLKYDFSSKLLGEGYTDRIITLPCWPIIGFGQLWPLAVCTRVKQIQNMEYSMHLYSDGRCVSLMSSLLKALF
jgi:hypothetical protein